MAKKAFLIALLAASSSFASDINWSWQADSRVRYESFSQSDLASSGALAKIDQVVQRTRLHLKANKGETVSTKISLLHNFDWGRNQAVSGDDATDGIANSNTNENQLLVNQAFFTWALAESYTFRFGRRNLNWAHGKVVAESDFLAVPVSFDGVDLTWDHDIFSATLFYNRTQDNTNFSNQVGGTGGPSDPEAIFWGFWADLKAVHEWFKTAHFHAFQQRQDEIVGGTDSASTTINQLEVNVIRFGLALGGDIGTRVSYDFNFARYSGETKTTVGGSLVDMSGSMVDFNLGYDHDGIFEIRAGYHTDSGDDGSDANVDTYDAFFYDAHANAGAMDVFNWGNLTYFWGGLAVPIKGYRIAADYFQFTQTEESTSQTAGLSGGNLPAPNGTDSDLGSEVDVSLSRVYDSGLGLALRYSIFMPGKAYTSPNDEKYTQIFFQASMNF